MKNIIKIFQNIDKKNERNFGFQCPAAEIDHRFCNIRILDALYSDMCRSGFYRQNYRNKK